MFNLFVDGLAIFGAAVIVYPIVELTFYVIFALSVHSPG
jgi:hypothetical protein